MKNPASAVVTFGGWMVGLFVAFFAAAGLASIMGFLLRILWVSFLNGWNSINACL